MGPLEFDFGVYFLDQNGDFDCSVETPSALKVLKDMEDFFPSYTNRTYIFRMFFETLDHSPSFLLILGC